MSKRTWQRWVPNWSSLLFFALMGVWGYVLWRTGDGFKRGKYTIGYVTGRSVAPSSGWSVQYRFVVNDTVYTGSKSERTGMNYSEGALYLVKYDSTAPKWHEIYYEDPIPDSIQRTPRNGWRWRPWPDPEYPELSGPAPGPAPAPEPVPRDSAHAAMWAEMEATQASADSISARNRRR